MANTETAFCPLPSANWSAPLVSVLMPTFRQAAFIRRALESLWAQTLTDWELIIIDDGSPDETARIIEPYLADPRVRYQRLERNGGLGNALNVATALARGRYVAYLPSDDLYYPDHLQRLVTLLDTRPDVYLAYGGLRWAYSRYGATLQGDEAVGREAEALAHPPVPERSAKLTNGNILALVQVLHRRDLEREIRWATRAEIVSDSLEPDFWKALLGQGARFGYAGEITCEWVEHPDQRHTIIAGINGGLSRYRRFYGVGRDVWLNWQPTHGPRVHEQARYGQLVSSSAPSTSDGLKILLVGSLGFGPERLRVFTERGHRLYGLWLPRPEGWDATGPLPYLDIEDVPYDQNWRERVRAIAPDVIYALLNWQAVPLIAEVLHAKRDVPFVFHFKEGPFICLEHGLWDTLIHILTESDGQIFISPENRDWFQIATGGTLDPESTFILDGDMPALTWQTDNWSPKLSQQDGAIHTVCTGRPLGLDPFEAIAEAGIHVHFYGDHFHRMFPNWARTGVATGFMHLHSTVEPANWVRELSQYDAAWFHVFTSHNQGDLRRAHWDDLNLPARLGTYAAAGLPWLLKDNRGSQVALQRIAQQHDVGVFFKDFGDLAHQLRDSQRVAQLTTNMRVARHLFAFDTHVDELVAFFRRVIAQYRTEQTIHHRDTETQR